MKLSLRLRYVCWRASFWAATLIGWGAATAGVANLGDSTWIGDGVRARHSARLGGPLELKATGGEWRVADSAGFDWVGL